ncbi:hypothetical protein ACQKDS_04460 [Serratia sp. NPDC078593]|uniref:hypothetical protein n=1 Tax=unclassified Serratia (in: enterobacteria) TaxID=2647522 RepID=UPI0037D6984C
MKKTVAVVTVCLLLAGCQNAANRSKAKSEPAVTANNAAALQVKAETAGIGNDEVMYSCIKELNALQQINPALYQTKSSQLNHIVTQAKLYIKVRESVSTDTSKIMDAAYQYRIAKICNEVRTDLTNSLVERVEKS